ncbi:MAG: aminotransferase class V-fold PLP-dependent enzyme, partial [Wolbachia sp.]
MTDKSSSPFSLGSDYVYADYNATSPIIDSVKKSILEVLSKQILNPSSLHRRGQEARKILQDARDNVRGIIGALGDKEVVFTSGATEANNLVMRGIAGYRYVISAIEHPSILNSAYNPHIIPVNQEGVVDLLELEKILSKLERDRVIVSVMMANNETGVIQPVKEVA